MPVRATMAPHIAKIRTMISDPASASSQFADQDIQDQLDQNRDDIRYLQLTMAPSIVNAASTGNQPQMIFADYYSVGYDWWESDVVLQGYTSGQPYLVLTPAAFEPLVGHWQFEVGVFTSGTVPGQYPPVFATGKVYDLNAAAADLLEFWAASLAGAYDIVVDGQNLRRSQLMQSKLTMAQYFRKRAKPRMAKMIRSDIAPEMSGRSTPVLDGMGGFGGTY